MLDLGNVFAPRRALRPTRKGRKAVGGQNLTDRKVHVMVTITRAYDIPCRVTDSKDQQS